jgi:hypothetical protein
MNEATPWYVAVGDTSVGPVETDLVIRGIEHRRIPPDALVCEVGATSWSALASVEPFHAAVVRSYPPPPPESPEAQSWLQQGFHFPSLGALPRFTDPLEDAPADAGHAGHVSHDSFDDPLDATSALTGERLSAPDLTIDVDEGDDEDDAEEIAVEPHLDWSERFQSYFLVGDAVELPDEQSILDSLSVISRETFEHEEALWNLALCLAFGSERVGEAAARTFFDSVADRDSESVERVAWMSRTLAGNGFVPSGIPREAGRRAIERLRSSCPPALSPKLGRALS